jgi:hypothetical protein
MAFTQNFNSDTFGPIQWKLMGPIADRPATADLHTTYLSTDEGNGMLKAYLYTESGWMQMQSIEGFTSGGGGSGGGSVFTINFTTDDGWSTIEADKTFAETLAAVNSGATVYAVALEMNEGAVAYAYTMPCISSSDATISFDNYYIQAQDNQLWVSRVDYFSTGSMEYTFKKYTLTPAT